MVQRKTKAVKRAPVRPFPAPGYYDDNHGTDDRRVYFITGTTAGNAWLDVEDTDGEWWPLTWTCVPTVKEAETFKHSAGPPEGVPTMAIAEHNT